MHTGKLLQGVVYLSSENDLMSKCLATTISMQPSPSKPNDSASTPNQVGHKDLKTLTNLGNGFASDPVFGDVFTATSVQVKQNSPVHASPANSLPVSSDIASSGPQTTARPSLPGPLQTAPAQLMQVNKQILHLTLGENGDDMSTKNSF